MNPSTMFHPSTHHTTTAYESTQHTNSNSKSNTSVKQARYVHTYTHNTIMVHQHEREEQLTHIQSNYRCIRKEQQEETPAGNQDSSVEESEQIRLVTYQHDTPHSYHPPTNQATNQSIPAITKYDTNISK